MADPGSKMRCPKCGETMNHHADKPVDPTDSREATLVDPDFDAVIEEIYGCPHCGAMESRPVSVTR